MSKSLNLLLLLSNVLSFSLSVRPSVMLLIEQALKERKRTFYCGCGKFQVNFSLPQSLARSKRVHHIDIIMIIKRRRATDDDSCCFLWLAYRYLFLQALAPVPVCVCAAECQITLQCRFDLARFVM